MKHLLSVADLSRADIEELLRLTDSFVEVSARAIPKVPTLRGKTIVSLFFEDSTRTRLSFDAAAKRLGADTMTFTAVVAQEGRVDPRHRADH
jgi:aspartate carbamoyltransferase catalytic subunit